MKIYVTKYALTRGILELDATRCSGGRACVQHDGRYSTYYTRNEWHTSRAAARARAEEMRQRKICSLRDQLDRLQSLSFDRSPVNHTTGE